MQTLRLIALLAFFSIGSFGCGAAGGGFSQRFTAACDDASNLPPEICECLAEKAEEELSEDARNFLLLSLEGNEDAIAEAREKLGFTEAMEAGLFMTEAASCPPPPEGAGAQ